MTPCSPDNKHTSAVDNNTFITVWHTHTHTQEIVALTPIKRVRLGEIQTTSKFNRHGRHPRALRDEELGDADASQKTRGVQRTDGRTDRGDIQRQKWKEHQPP